MKRATTRLLIVVASLIYSTFLVAQAPAIAVTVPLTLDHNRIVIDVYVPLNDGTTKRVRGLVDTGATQLMLSQRIAKLTGATVTCSGERCSVLNIPAEIRIGDIAISLANTGPAIMQQRLDANFSDVMIPGMSPEVLIPATVLKKYDIVVDYANRQFTIGPPGSVKFSGRRIPAQMTDDGLITVSGQIAGQQHFFGFDTGLAASLTDSKNLGDWHKAQPAWPYAPGVLAAANMTGGPDEVNGAMLRIPSIQIGAASLLNLIVTSNDKGVEPFDHKTPSVLAALLGGEAFKGSRIGIDYAHSTLYIEQVTSAPVSGLDVVGLTLRPEVNGRYTVVAVAPYEGQPSVADVKVGDVLVGVDGAPVTGATMGQVWSLLGGEPGQARKLIIERDGKRITVAATVRRFLSHKKN